MQIQRIVRTAGITAAALGLYACTPKSTNHTENSAQKENKQEVMRAPLTQDFLGMTVVYKSKEDSIKANNYLKRIIEDALPIEKEYDKSYDELVDLDTQKKVLYTNGLIAQAVKTEKQIAQKEHYMDSIWDILKTKIINVDSVNQHTIKSDLDKNDTYLYDWFKEAVIGEER